jgi:death-on-curing protein
LRFLDVDDVLRLYHRVMEASGGTPGLRDQGLLESAVAGPRMSFGGEELYPTLAEKAAALAYALARNHPFVDGNKRIALAAADAMLRLNGFRLEADDDTLERVFLELAAGRLSRKALAEFVASHLGPRPAPREG